MPSSSFRTTFDGMPPTGSAASPSIEEKIKVLVDLWEIKVPTLTSQKKSTGGLRVASATLGWGTRHLKHVVIAAVNRCATQRPDVGDGE
jgi:hypothetical protein